MQSRPSAHEPVMVMVMTLDAEMGRRFHGVDFLRILPEATELDPRFKQRGFTDARAADHAVKSILQLPG